MMVPRQPPAEGPAGAAADAAGAAGDAAEDRTAAAPAADFRRARAEDPGRELLAVLLGEARFGLWIDEVLEILRTPPISRLPLAVSEIAGVTSVRGEIVPVLDLGERLLGTPAARPGQLVVVRHDASESLVALLVDGVDTLLPVKEDDIRPPPPETEAELPPGYVTGLVAAESGVVTILNLGVAAAPPGPATEGASGA